MSASPGRTTWSKRADTVLVSRLRRATRLTTGQRSDAQDSSLACDEQPVRWAPCLASGLIDRIAPSAAGPAPPDPDRKAPVSQVATRRRYKTRPASHMRLIERSFSRLTQAVATQVSCQVLRWVESLHSMPHNGAKLCVPVSTAGTRYPESTGQLCFSRWLRPAGHDSDSTGPTRTWLE